jgi:hypothetical protein
MRGMEGVTKNNCWSYVTLQKEYVVCPLDTISGLD